jgi:hypothetical protein
MAEGERGRAGTVAASGQGVVRAVLHRRAWRGGGVRTGWVAWVEVAPVQDTTRSVLGGVPQMCAMCDERGLCGGGWRARTKQAQGWAGAVASALGCLASPCGTCLTICSPVWILLGKAFPNRVNLGRLTCGRQFDNKRKRACPSKLTL